MKTDLPDIQERAWCYTLNYLDGLWIYVREKKIFYENLRLCDTHFTISQLSKALHILYIMKENASKANDAI